jgi:mannitol-1-phosphate 5-dehydrogenase
VVEEYFQFAVERSGLVGEPPAIEGMLLTDNIDAYLEQKLFTLNAAHAVVAYLGYLRGHEFTHEAMGDPEIRPVVLGAHRELSTVLIEKHGLDRTKQEQYATSILRRFENVSLQDPITRVAREPKRKLLPNDRLIKPALLAVELGIKPTCLATGIAAALLYDYAEDEQAAELSRELEEQGTEAVLVRVCGLAADSALTRLVMDRMHVVESLKGDCAPSGSAQDERGAKVR